MRHSCTNYGLEHHFEGVSLKVRRTFDRFLEVIEGFGPVTVIPQKTRIAIMVKVRFAGCVVRKKVAIGRSLDHLAHRPPKTAKDREIRKKVLRPSVPV